MAKKTKDSNLSLEERLEQALIPNWDEPYKLPDNWCWLKLLSAFENYTDSKKKIKQKDYLESGLWSVVDQGQSLVGGYTNDETMLYNGNLPVIIFGDHTRCVKYIDFNFAQGADGVKVLRPKPFYLPKFFFYALQNVDIPNLGYRRHFPLFDKFSIPLAPLEEQQRIVEHVESLFAKLDEAKEKAQEVVDGFDTRKAAILHKAFSGELTAKWRGANTVDSFAYVESIDEKMQHCKKKKMKKSANEFVSAIKNLITSDWTYVDLDRISKLITDGEHKTPRRVDEFEGYYLLSARNIHNDLLMLDDVDYVDELEFAMISKRCNPKRNDLLISCSGSVGRCCVIEDNNNYVMVRSAAMVSLLGGNPRFVMYMLQSDYLQEQIKKLSKQTAQANLFLGAISALIIPFPDIKEQNEIVRILDNLFVKERNAKEMAETVIEQIETMKKAILARAFRGELGTNDPSEESAVELLKKVLDGDAAVQTPAKKPTKRISIPSDIKELLSNIREEEIIKLLLKSAPQPVSIQEIMSLSSKKFELMDALRSLEKKQLITKNESGEYSLTR